MLRLEMLPAGCGDCLWLEYGEPGKTRIVLIDGGIKATATRLAARIRAAMAERRDSKLTIDLLVITHYDTDHIDGVLELLENYNLPVYFGDIWFNGDVQLAKLPPPTADELGDLQNANDTGQDDLLPADMLGAESSPWSPADLLGAAEGEDLSKLLRERGLPWNQAVGGDAVMIPQAGTLPERRLPDGLKLTLLGPSITRLRDLAQEWQGKVGTFDPAKLIIPEEEPDDLLGPKDAWPPIWIEGEGKDPSKPNGSSIALLAEYQGQALLLAGDAYAGDLDHGLSRLQAQPGYANTPLPLAGFKLPHHGSANNLSRQLLERINCSRYLISTDGSKAQRHPDHQSLLRILRYGGPMPLLMFNYEGDTTRNWQALKKDVLQRGFPDYDTAYPANPGDGLVLNLP
jgi:hypothetical protein